MHSISKSFKWEMAHRLVQDYPGKCKNIHGHTYTCEVKIAGFISTFGMVLDFGHVSEYMKSWVMRYLDHAMVVAEADRDMRIFLEKYDQRHFVLPAHLPNSTAENLTCLLADTFQGILRRLIDEDLADKSCVLEEVVVWETADSKATWRRG